METLAHLHRHRRRPAFSRLRTSSATYLTTARLHLLKSLPSNHRLYYRATATGNLKASNDFPPELPRIPFTDEELAQIRLRRRYTPDPEDVRYQLQDSKLVQMWNADYEHEEQWKEYDGAKAAMEIKKEIAGLPEGRFDKDEVVRERRSKVVEVEDVTLAERSVLDRMLGADMEEGEVWDEIVDCAREVREEEEEEGEEVETESLRNLRESNDRLRAANEAMRVVASRLQDNMLPASPVSEKSESSGDESDDSTDSMEAVCEFDLRESEDEERDTFEYGAPLELEDWLEDLGHGFEKMEEEDTSSEGEGALQLGRELG